MAVSLSAMLHLFEPKIQEKNLVLVKEYDKKIPEVLVGDPVRLHQIILNLVSNAVKFTSRGKITVRVQVLFRLCVTITLSNQLIFVSDKKSNAHLGSLKRKL